MKVLPKTGSLGGKHKTILKKDKWQECVHGWWDEARTVNVSIHSGLLWPMHSRLGFHVAKGGRWGRGFRE